MTGADQDRSADSVERVVAFPDRAAGSADADNPARSPLSNWRKPALVGVGVLGLAFGGAGLWAATAPLDSAVLARGTIAVESSRKVVEHVDGGTVEEILVEEGDRVQRGQLLVRMDKAQAQASFDAVRAQLDSALARMARLRAERDDAPQVRFPETLRRRSDVPKVAQVMAGARNQFLARQQSLQGKVGVQEQRIVQVERRISGLQAQRDSVIRQTEIMRDELSGLRELMEKGYYPRIRVLERERELARLEGRQGKLAGDLAQARESIAERRMQINQLRTSFREKVVSSLREVETRAENLRQRLVQTRAKLNRKDVLARFAGVVHDLRVNSPGAVVDPGGQILQLIPREDELVVEARVRPRDIDLVAQGMSAEVRMTALATAATPILMGHLTRVSPDRLTDPKTERPYYSARITIPPTELKKLGTQELKAGMPAEVMIQTGEQTLVDYIWKPISDAISRGMVEK